MIEVKKEEIEMHPEEVKMLPKGRINPIRGAKENNLKN